MSAVTLPYLGCRHQTTAGRIEFSANIKARANIQLAGKQDRRERVDSHRSRQPRTAHFHAGNPSLGANPLRCGSLAATGCEIRHGALVKVVEEMERMPPGAVQIPLVADSRPLDGPPEFAAQDVIVFGSGRTSRHQGAELPGRFERGREVPAQPALTHVGNHSAAKGGNVGEGSLQPVGARQEGVAQRARDLRQALRPDSLSASTRPAENESKPAGRAFSTATVAGESQCCWLKV